ncbi:hypothetical protein EK599_03935 [Vibrio sp. T187]|uniref:hypothetical protein n=1 Tax=Vibrio TaxID=662 RepID=UPI0010C9894D|nr:MULTISPECIES: hypothetical protein [Vibrio]MBW3694826.1 hypothetical protein [Vibrio sp. T187]
MKIFRLQDLSYNGAHKGNLSWDHPTGTQPYYWHPDWVHDAEDALGLYPKNSLSLHEGEEHTNKVK